MFITASVIIIFFGAVCGYTSYEMCTFFDKLFDSEFTEIEEMLELMEIQIIDIKNHIEK